MTLTERIQALRKDREQAERNVKDARSDLWADRAKNPHQWDNESDEHFEHRKKRDKEREKRKDEAKTLAVKKLKAIEHEINVLQKAKDEQKDHEVPNPDPDGDNWAQFDGKMVASWMVGENPAKRNYLQEIRDAGWDGYIVSGGRTPAYSIYLCQQMCGAPSCPGKCAGAASNHAKNDPFPNPNGAVDVSDYDTFERLAIELGIPYLKNLLPIDAVHFSPSGR